ncbi:MAG: uncharacterized protein JWN79_1092 [Gemmatimonadetes bacterium]|jgi:uncharacterized DUF497 family protein|nr:uncharacterized protein [Gemmatimonadota bacterium]
MDPLRFEWDARKAAANLRRHGIAFAEAETAFLDEHAAVMPDPEHSDDEDRFLLLGMSAARRVVVVVHCLRERGAVIRLISARKATRSERAQYDARWKR